MLGRSLIINWQVTWVLDNKLGEIKEQLISDKSLQSGSIRMANSPQQKELWLTVIVDDYNTQHDTHSGCHVQRNRQDIISAHEGDDDMTVTSQSEVEIDLEGEIVKFVSKPSSSSSKE